MTTYTKLVIESQTNLVNARTRLQEIVSQQNSMCAGLASLRSDYTVTDLETFRERIRSLRDEVTCALDDAYEAHDAAVDLIEERIRERAGLPTREEEAKTEGDRWIAASRAIHARITAAVKERDPDNVSAGMIYSAYDLKDDIPQDNLDTVFAHGSYWVTVEGCDYFGNGESYKSEATVTDPTMLDLAIHANASMPVTGDRHHIFFEGARVLSIPGGWDEPGVIVLHFGS